MEKTLGSEVKVVDDFNGSNVSKWKESLRGGITDYMNLSLNQDMTYVKNGTNSIRLQIDNGNWTAWEQTNFVSGLTMTKEDFFGTDKLEQIDYIEIHLYNSSEIEFDLSLRLETQKGSAAARSKSFYSVTLKKGWNTIKIPSVSMFKWMSGEEDLLAYLTGVIIEFEKIEEDVDIYLDTIFYTYLK